MCNGQSGCGQVFPSFRLPSFSVGRAARGMSANVEISYKFTCLRSQWYISMCVCLCVPLHMCKCFSQHSGMHVWLLVNLCVQDCTHPSCPQTELVRTVHGQYQYLFNWELVTVQCTVFIYRKQPRIREEYHWKNKSDWLWNLADLIQTWGDVYRKRKRHTSSWTATLQYCRMVEVSGLIYRNIPMHTGIYLCTT